MFIVVPFSKSTGVVIVAEAKLRFGDFSEKIFRHSADSFPFVWPSQLDIHQFFANLKDSAAFLGFLLQFQLAYGTWKFFVLISDFFLDKCLLMSSSVMRFFSLQLFPF